MTAEEIDDDQALELAAYVLGSRYRNLIIADLEAKPRIPSKIASRHDISRSHISRALSELRNKGLVRVHGEGSRTKLYSLTSQGEEVKDLVSDLKEQQE